MAVLIAHPDRHRTELWNSYGQDPGDAAFGGVFSKRQAWIIPHFPNHPVILITWELMLTEFRWSFINFWMMSVTGSKMRHFQQMTVSLLEWMYFETNLPDLLHSKLRRPIVQTQ